MEWWLAGLLILGTLGVLLLSGLPVAFSFLFVCLVGANVFFGGAAGMSQLILSLYESVTTFTLCAVPLFIFMGEIILQSGLGFRALDVLDRWLGRLPGRLSLLAVGGGTIFAALSGSSVANTALLGTVLAPEMESRGYAKQMVFGPILGGGALAIIIPPSSLTIILGSIAQISVASLLIGGLIPGLIIGGLFAGYIIVMCLLNPSLAPVYDLGPTPMLSKMLNLVRYVLPLGLIFFLAVMVIFLGIATPTEAAATAALGSIILAASYGKLNFTVMKKATDGTVQVTILFFMILVSSLSFSQLLAFSGASRGLVEVVLGLSISPIFIIILMQFVILVMGCFIDMASIIMICLPLYMPVVRSLGFDPVWFGLISLLCVEIGGLTPPFGLNLFVMKGVAPASTTMNEIYGAALPFVLLELIAIALFFVFPEIIIWLPNLMH